MATLTATQLADMRFEMRKRWTTAINFEKPLLNAVFQVIENEYERTGAASKTGFKNQAVLEADAAAKATKSFTTTELRALRDAYLVVKMRMEGLF